MKTLLTAIYKVIANMSPVTQSLVGVVPLLIAVNTYVTVLWGTMFTKIDALVVPAGGSSGPVVGPLGFVNYVFPLSELCTYLVSYLALRAICVGIRMIKSFVPSISG